MNIHEAIHGRRTAHFWTPKKVPTQVVERALIAAQMAPCHRLSWPWRFTLPGPETRQKLYQLGVSLKVQNSGLTASEHLRNKLKERLLHPELVVVSQVVHADPVRREEDYAACACAIQNLCLSFFADGFHSKWSTGTLTTHSETYQLLQIPIASQRIVGFIWVGEPSRERKAPPRPPLEVVVRKTE